MVEAVGSPLQQTESQIEEMFKRGVLIPFKANCEYLLTKYLFNSNDVMILPFFDVFREGIFRPRLLLI